MLSVTPPHTRLRRVGSMLVLAILIAASLIAHARDAAAQCTTNSDCMWPVGCGYTGPAGVPIPISGPVGVRGLNLTDLPPCTPVPSGPFFIDSFFDVFVEISLDGGATWVPKSASGHERSNLTPTSPPASNPRTFDTEMVQLDISGGTLPAGMMLRESPTIASTGKTTDTSLGGGQFKIDSFFDVFVELSTDGGQTWMPASQPTRETLGTGQPTSVRVSTWGAVKSFYR
ncbi:MAG TPA: hypothetical protein VI504_06690 [Candidatus Eisenbacteria bacterium]